MQSPSQHSSKLAEKASVTIAGLAAVLLLAGCESQTKADPAPSTSASKSSTTDPAAADKAKVLAAVKGMHQAQAAAYAKDSEKDTHLQRYAADKALSKIRVDLFNYQQTGIVFQGAPEIAQSQVTAIDVQQSPKKATVQECVDTSHWIPVKKNGDRVQVTDSTRKFVATESLETIGSDWFVMDYQIDKGRPC